MFYIVTGSRKFSVKYGVYLTILVFVVLVSFHFNHVAVRRYKLCEHVGITNVNASRYKDIEHHRRHDFQSVAKDKDIFLFSSYLVTAPYSQ